jgi:hypothetical protein
VLSVLGCPFPVGWRKLDIFLGRPIDLMLLAQNPANMVEFSPSIGEAGNQVWFSVRLTSRWKKVEYFMDIALIVIQLKDFQQE